MRPKRWRTMNCSDNRLAAGEALGAVLGPAILLEQGGCPCGCPQNEDRHDRQAIAHLADADDVDEHGS